MRKASSASVGTLFRHRTMRGLRDDERRGSTAAPPVLAHASYPGSLPTFEVSEPTFGVSEPTFEVRLGRGGRFLRHETPANAFLFSKRPRIRPRGGATDLWSKHLRPLKEEAPTFGVSFSDLWSKKSRPLKEEVPTFGVRALEKAPANKGFWLARIDRLVLFLFLVLVVFNNIGSTCRGLGPVGGRCGGRV